MKAEHIQVLPLDKQCVEHALEKAKGRLISQSESLRASKEQLIALDPEEQSASDFADEVYRELKVILGSGKRSGELPELLGDPVVGNRISQHLSELQTLVLCKQLLVICGQIDQGIAEMEPLIHQGSIDMAIEFFHKELEPKVRLVKESDQDVNSNLSESDNLPLVADAKAYIARMLSTLKLRIIDPICTTLAKYVVQNLERAGWPNTYPSSIDHNSKHAIQQSLAVDSTAGAFIAALCEPLALRIRFNFASQSKTFRAANANWMLEYAFKLLETHTEALSRLLQPFVPIEISISDLICESLIKLTCLTSALEPYVIAACMGSDGASPGLLVFQIAEFERKVIQRLKWANESLVQKGALGPNRQGYLVGFALEHWPQLADAWISAERKAALTALSTSLSCPDAWDIDLDAVPARDCTKPTVSALVASQLAHQIVSHILCAGTRRTQLRLTSEALLEVLERYAAAALERLAQIANAPENNSSFANLDHVVVNKSIRDASAVRTNRFEAAAQVRAAVSHMATIAHQMSRLSVFADLFAGLDAHIAGEAFTLFDESISALASVTRRASIQSCRSLAHAIQISARNYVNRPWRISGSDFIEGGSPDLVAPTAIVCEALLLSSQIDSRRDKVIVSQQYAAVSAEFFATHVLQVAVFTRWGARQLCVDLAKFWAQTKLPRVAAFRKLFAAAQFLAGEGDCGLDHSEQAALERRLVLS